MTRARRQEIMIIAKVRDQSEELSKIEKWLSSNDADHPGQLSFFWGYNGGDLHARQKQRPKARSLATRLILEGFDPGLVTAVMRIPD